MDGCIQGRALLPCPADPLPHGWRIALAEHLLGEVFGLLHVWLVEDIDPQDRTRDRDRIFPPKELGAQAQWVAELERYHGVPGFTQRRQAGGIGVRPAGQGQPHEEPVMAIDLRRSQRLVGHRHEALAFFAGALGDQLLRPDPEASHRGRRDDRDLIAANLGRLSKDRTEPGAGILGHRHRW